MQRKRNDEGRAAARAHSGERRSGRKQDPGSARQKPSNAPGGLLPAPTLPKGGGAIRSIGEKYTTDPSTGSGSLTVPLATSPGRAGFELGLQLSYDTGAGNSEFGLGWRLSVPQITRKTDRGLPTYDDEADADTYVMSGAEDLVPVPAPSEPTADHDFAVQRYRPRVEGLFARIERWTRRSDGDVHWRVTTRDNVTSIYGRSAGSRVMDDGAPRPRVFSWLLEETRDDRGNVARYSYKPEDGVGVRATLAEQARVRSWRAADNADQRLHVDGDGCLARAADGTLAYRATAQRYLKRIQYGNRVPVAPEQEAPTTDDAYLFEVVLDYGEHAHNEDDLHGTTAPPPVVSRPWQGRRDPFSSHRSGFEVRTHRLCRRVLVFHRFGADARGIGVDPCLVRSTDFVYEENAVATYLLAVVQAGYAWDEEEGLYRRRTVPPLELGYRRVPDAFDDSLKVLDDGTLEGLPAGVASPTEQWVDLDGEGLPGVLQATSEGWYYKRNLGQARLERPVLQRALPSPVDLGAEAQLVDLDGDGSLDVVGHGTPGAGYFARTADGGWEPFRAFGSVPQIDWDDPNLRMVDVDGDGLADVLIAEDDVFVWYRSRGKTGFESPAFATKPHDEVVGAAVVFSDGTQSISLADMSGDGLQDIVRVRRGELSYWPNLGYGRFGARITLAVDPAFDTDGQFDPARIRFGDLDGSGTSDVIYLGRDEVSVYLNESGNALSAPRTVRSLPTVDSVAQLYVVDLLGNGTSCLVWSSPIGDRRVVYVDPLGGKKPHLLESVDNNLGAVTRIAYAPSTKFYLADRQAGRPWLTRLGFVVQVVERVERYDFLQRTHLVSEFSYHHGYFDGDEREFRGFARVSQWDAESYGGVGNESLFPEVPEVEGHGADVRVLPPTRTDTWFHTGAWLDGKRLESELVGEYYDGDLHRPLLPDTVVPSGLTPDEERQVARALRGRMLRQEVYAEDGSAAESHPYSVVESNHAARLLHAPVRAGEHAVVMVHEHTSLSLAYERRSDDPRMVQSVVLEVDDYGNATKTASIAYPRRPRDGENLPEQQRLLATVQMASFVHRDGGWSGAGGYRVGIPVEVVTCELTGLTAPLGIGQWLRVEEVRAAVDAATIVPFHATPAAGPALRVVEADCKRYYADPPTDLDSDEALLPLPVGDVGWLALLHETYRLGLTDELVDTVIAHDDEGGRVSVDDDWLRDDGGYVAVADIPVATGHEQLLPPAVRAGTWWAPSGRVVYDDAARARTLFFQAEKSVDPFGAEQLVVYDDHQLLVVEARLPRAASDPVGSITKSDNDYRVLAPYRLTEPNGNRTEVAFDPLGLVVATALRGKEGTEVGDSLEGAPWSGSTIEEVVSDPLTHLRSATTLLAYDVHAFRRTRDDATPQPGAVCTVARESHVSDLAAGEESATQVVIAYSDGSGRELLRKVQAESGEAPLREDGVLVRDDDGGLVYGDVARWVGTGRTVFDNKGNPVKKYEPYFSSTAAFEDERELVEYGVSPTLVYDPLGRVVRTDQPDGTYSQVVFDAWLQETWDESDTVLTSAWYHERGAPNASSPEPRVAPTTTDPSAIEEISRRRAAWLSAQHEGTPSSAHLDPLGRVFLNVARNRITHASPLQELRTRIELDIEGNERAVTDARGVVVLAQDFDVLGRVIRSDSPDAGERYNLLDVADAPARTWDERGQAFRYRYDLQRRPTHLFVDDRLVQRTVYGEALGASATVDNHRGQVYRTYDGSGVVTTEAYDFKGNDRSTTRRFSKGDTAPDWSALSDPSLTPAEMESASASNLESTGYSESRTFDALNRVVVRRTPDGSEYRPQYNEAGLLETIDIAHRGSAPRRFIERVDYNPRGQRVRIEYGNRAVTTFDYDPASFRLRSLVTTREGGGTLQALSYEYDAVGNIVELSDGAQQSFYFGGDLVEARRRYRYDALNQLIFAEGREHPGQQPTDVEYPELARAVPHPNNDQALKRYTEEYVYDEVGNILTMDHRRGTYRWTRHYAYHSNDDFVPLSNRLFATSSEGETIPAAHRHSATTTSAPYAAKYGYDAHGNVISAPHLDALAWDYADRLVHIDRGGGGFAHYTYDSVGERVRKVVVKGGIREERIYLGSYERYRRYDAGNLVLERESLHVMDGERRIAIVETTMTGASPTVRTRHNLDDHLGSSMIELDDAAQVIGYEEYFPYGGSSYRASRASAEVSARRYRYNGKERDEETGLYSYGARFYAPWLGRWMSADPAGFVDGTNLFGYARQNPIGLRDPKGFASVPTQAEVRQIADEVLGDIKNAVGRGAREGMDVDHLVSVKSLYRDYGRTLSADQWRKLFAGTGDLYALVDSSLNRSKGDLTFLEYFGSSNPKVGGLSQTQIDHARELTRIARDSFAHNVDQLRANPRASLGGVENYAEVLGRRRLATTAGTGGWWGGTSRDSKKMRRRGRLKGLIGAAVALLGISLWGADAAASDSAPVELPTAESGIREKYVAQAKVASRVNEEIAGVPGGMGGELLTIGVSLQATLSLKALDFAQLNNATKFHNRLVPIHNAPYFFDQRSGTVYSVSLGVRGEDVLGDLVPTAAFSKNVAGFYMRGAQAIYQDEDARWYMGSFR